MYYKLFETVGGVKLSNPYDITFNPFVLPQVLQSIRTETSGLLGIMIDTYNAHNHDANAEIMECAVKNSLPIVLFGRAVAPYERENAKLLENDNIKVIRPTEEHDECDENGERIYMKSAPVEEISPRDLYNQTMDFFSARATARGDSSAAGAGQASV